jgi:hypothetical protein
MNLLEYLITHKSQLNPPYYSYLKTRRRNLRRISTPVHFKYNSQCFIANNILSEGQDCRRKREGERKGKDHQGEGSRLFQSDKAPGCCTPSAQRAFVLILIDLHRNYRFCDLFCIQSSICFSSSGLVENIFTILRRLLKTRGLA